MSEQARRNAIDASACYRLAESPLGICKVRFLKSNPYIGIFYIYIYRTYLARLDEVEAVMKAVAGSLFSSLADDCCGSASSSCFSSSSVGCFSSCFGSATTGLRSSVVSLMASRLGRLLRAGGGGESPQLLVAQLLSVLSGLSSFSISRCMEEESLIFFFQVNRAFFFFRNPGVFVYTHMVVEAIEMVLSID